MSDPTSWKVGEIVLPMCRAELVFELVQDREWAQFLDSGVVDANRGIQRKHADFDVLAINPAATLVYENGIATTIRGDRQDQQTCDPIDAAKALLPKVEPATTLSANAYLPGLLGYFSYDLARYFERMPNIAADDENLPEMALGFYPTLLVIDHAKQVTRLVFLENYPGVEETVREWHDIIEQAAKGQNQAINHRWRNSDVSENLDFYSYRQRFERVKHYITEGDCYQVNLTKRFSASVGADSWQTYLALRDSSPAPYAAFQQFPFATVLSNSPESFIQCRDRQVVTSPIKGTRPRDHTSSENDAKIAAELSNSPKDRAENLMIVDLMRNDLSRCCELASVKVPKLFALHSFANVHHLISTITGTLREELHSLDLLKSCFPGGSITGAPKIRSMEIIEELEPDRRGLYCGAIGYVGVDGDLETNIAIRTMVVKEGVVRFSAGGGVVVDSELEAEYQELHDKASKMLAMLD
ncbi:MAG: aminodeoxychorismate synthase component I [Pseudomonadota bacterium]